MNILHVIPGVASRYGGPSQAVLEMCRALRGHGNVDALIATTDADGASRLPVELGNLTQYDGVPTIFFCRQWSESLKYSRPLADWLEAHVADFDAVHIHAIFSHACLAAARSCQRFGVPYVISPHGTIDPWSLRQKPLRKRLFWHFGVKQMLACAARVHYTTAEEKRLAESALDLDRGIVIPLGIDEAVSAKSVTHDQFRQQYPTLRSDPYVLVLSRLHPKKGLDIFLDVFLDVVNCAEYVNWRLVIAGDGDPAYVGRLKHIVQKRGGDDRVLFTGWLDSQEKIAALQGAALFAMPSYQENFGVALVEALACGVPVLVSPHVNLAEDVKAAGAGWVVPLDRSALAVGLSATMQDRDERDRRGSAGRELAQAHFTWPRIAVELRQLYDAIRRLG